MNTVSQAIAFLKTQKWVDLSHQVNPTIPYFPAFKPLETKLCSRLKMMDFSLTNIL
ncbi:hypothetical protein AAUPMB_01100 [Pasteurella multocida subsp. multocida str. Anand1_buffalo]|nr:hypothetical protein AAUPMB_01100 [Pasteurella multocida subsp. multocida str. Anand1_buffalo]